MPLSLGTCQAQNSEAFVEQLAGWLADRLEISVRYAADSGWQERYAALDAGALDVCWICGLPYVWRTGRAHPNVELLAAPIPRGQRYAGRPVYFSDVIVQAGSRAHSFDDLRGCTWGINELGSWSGYGVVRYHLAVRGHTLGYFGAVHQTGAHQESIRQVAAGRLDAAAVDSTVLDLELARDPSLARALRVVETLGPSPQPPWVIGRHVPARQRQAVRESLLSMHEDPQGRLILAAGLTERFAAVTDADYDELRDMAEAAGLREQPSTPAEPG